MCNLSRVLARVLSILRWPEIHPLPGTASTPADIAVWLILTVPVLAGPKFFSSTFQHLTFSEGTTPAFIGSGSQFNWEGLASFGHTQILQFWLPIKANRRHKEMSRKGMVSLFVSFSRGKNLWYLWCKGWPFIPFMAFCGHWGSFAHLPRHRKRVPSLEKCRCETVKR